MARPNNKRRRVSTDLKLQGVLCIRVSVYWFICQAAVVGTVLGFGCLAGSSSDSNDSHVRFLIPAICISTLILPIMLLDMLYFSNRFAGPMLSLRRKMQALAENKASDAVYFRRGDFYPELADYFNEIREHLQSRQATQLNAGALNQDRELEVSQTK